MDNTNFLKALDTLIELAGDTLKIQFFEDGVSRDDKAPSVFSHNGFVCWTIRQTDDLNILTDNLLKAESMIDDANIIRKYEEQSRLNHPNIHIAIRARIIKNHKYLI